MLCNRVPESENAERDESRHYSATRFGWLCLSWGLATSATFALSSFRRLSILLSKCLKKLWFTKPWVIEVAQRHLEDHTANHGMGV